MEALSEKIIEIGSNIDFNTKKIENSIVPIFHGAPGERPEFEGSSVYISIDDHLFLITAKHVIKSNPETIVIPTNTGEFSSIPTECFTYSQSDEIDIAIAKLSNPLNLFIPIPLRSIYNVEVGKGIPNKLIALGFPASKVKSFSTEAKGLLKKFASEESGISEYQRLNVDPRIGIVIDFNKDQVISLIKGPIEFPKPNGLSGGGLFWMHKKGIFERNKPVLLAAILTEWDPTTRVGMKATKIKYAMAMIKEKYGLEMPERLVQGIKISVET